MGSDRTDLNPESRSTLLLLEHDSAVRRFRLTPSCSNEPVRYISLSSRPQPRSGGEPGPRWRRQWKEIPDSSLARASGMTWLFEFTGQNSVYSISPPAAAAVVPSFWNAR